MRPISSVQSQLLQLTEQHPAQYTLFQLAAEAYADYHTAHDALKRLEGLRLVKVCRRVKPHNGMCICPVNYECQRRQP